MFANNFFFVSLQLYALQCVCPPMCMYVCSRWQRRACAPRFAAASLLCATHSPPPLHRAGAVGGVQCATRFARYPMWRPRRLAAVPGAAAAPAGCAAMALRGWPCRDFSKGAPGLFDLRTNLSETQNAEGRATLCMKGGLCEYAPAPAWHTPPGTYQHAIVVLVQRIERHLCTQNV